MKDTERSQTVTDCT